MQDLPAHARIALRTHLPLMIGSCLGEQSFLKMKLSQTCSGQIKPELPHKSFFKEHRVDALHCVASADVADLFGARKACVTLL